MTKFVLVRHGEADYGKIKNLGFRGYGMALAPLTDKGVLEIEETCKNEVFKGSDLLVSSPYTRALQSASIIGQTLNLEVNVDVLLHEWNCDYSNTYSTNEEFLRNIKQAKKEWNLGQSVENFQYSLDFEDFENVRKRALSALEKYCGYDKVIVVSHGLLISMLFNEKIRLHTGDLITTTSEELEENFDFHPKVKVLKY